MLRAWRLHQRLNAKTASLRRYLWALSTVAAIWSGSINALKILFAPSHTIVNELALLVTPMAVAIPIWKAARISVGYPAAPFLRWRNRRAIGLGFAGGLIAVAGASAAVAVLAATKGRGFIEFLLLIIASGASAVGTSKMFVAALVRLGGIAMAAAVAVPIASSLAFGWGDDGHRIVAIVAYAHLTDAARTLVDEMLAADGDTLTAPDFVSRATWADKYRDSDRGTTRLRYGATQAWHFVNIELDGPDIDAACLAHPAPATPASYGPRTSWAVDRIGDFAAEFANPTT